MKVKVQLYRVASVQADDIRHVVGCQGKASEVLATLREKFGPLAGGIRVFWNIVPDEGQGESDPMMAYVGIEAMAFDVGTDVIPVAGLVQTDPMSSEDLFKLDGALESELARWGLYMPSEAYEWRCYYEVKK